MENISLGKSKIKVSRIGIGTWQASFREWGSDVNDDSIIQAVNRSFDLGVNFIDTAEIYGNGHSEIVVGKAIKNIDREKLVVATKVHGAHLRHDELIKSAELSMKRLGVKYIDLYQVHWPDPWEQISLRETMKAMEELYLDGKIMAIGVSNFAVRDLEESLNYLSRASIVSNQVRYNMLQREIEEEVMPFCKKNGITIIAWSPLAQGALTAKYNVKNLPNDRIRSGNELFKKNNIRQMANLLKTLEKIAKSRGKTLSQIALNWLLSHDQVVPIPGAKTPQQAEANAGAAGWRLTPEELSAIEEELEKIDIDYM
ncbi:MAG: aldo/keto reductase [Nitrososphaerota archaeon]|jgi:aryl-alcohol dehydrogenase-like predicted oxidoreductase|nr:aldo/keto reductase [Nitrososphaerota archaeon]MDG6930646.1 aldo/keto reductase [Nitrososphaerota archaeon]MDG6932481.1 aldo/keto reductase [Nitrososphaerota archaeon]MDG6936238.1 aldo/keto reductase [Nitrososphaerota archaeon]MDG6944966.1 aldo/keto reductase [Nitrososphaerota archaeon]